MQKLKLKQATLLIGKIGQIKLLRKLQELPWRVLSPGLRPGFDAPRAAAYTSCQTEGSGLGTLQEPPVNTSDDYKVDDDDILADYEFPVTNNIDHKFLNTSKVKDTHSTITKLSSKISHFSLFAPATLTNKICSLHHIDSSKAESSLSSFSTTETLLSSNSSKEDVNVYAKPHFADDNKNFSKYPIQDAEVNETSNVKFYLGAEWNNPDTSEEDEDLLYYSIDNDELQQEKNRTRRAKLQSECSGTSGKTRSSGMGSSLSGESINVGSSVSSNSNFLLQFPKHSTLQNTQKKETKNFVTFSCCKNENFEETYDAKWSALVSLTQLPLQLCSLLTNITSKFKIVWSYVEIGCTLFTKIPCDLSLTNGFKDSLIALLEHGENNLGCEAVIVAIPNLRSDFDKLERNFNFMGFTKNDLNMANNNCEKLSDLPLELEDCSFVSIKFCDDDFDL